MKKIYLVLTHTGTVLSNIVKWYTKNKFSHISIALDENLKEMYSFGRKNPYNPFWGGLVHEYIDSGTFKRFYNTECEVYYLEIPDKSYKVIKNKILQMYDERNKYKFNIVGLFAVSINKKIKPKNSYYCAEFAQYLLNEANIKNELPTIIRPEHFKELDGIQEIYKGYLRDYKAPKKETVKL